MRALAEQTKSRRTRLALLELGEELARGVPLVEALGRKLTRLPRTVGTLIEAGLETGRLDLILQLSVEQSRRTAELRSQIWMSLAYPLLLFSSSILICGGILLGIAPQFGKIFADFNLVLPSLTTELIVLSRFILDSGWYPEYILCGGIACLWILFFWMGSSRWAARWSTSLPLIGTAFRFAALSDFCQILALLVETRLPFSRALRYSGDAGSDDWLRRKCQQMAVDIEQGSSPADAARFAKLPIAISQVFGHAPSEESMIGGLRGLANLYTARCTVSFQVVNSLVELLIVASVIGCVGVTVVALFVPLFNLVKALS